MEYGHTQNKCPMIFKRPIGLHMFSILFLDPLRLKGLAKLVWGPLCRQGQGWHHFAQDLGVLGPLQDLQGRNHRSSLIKRGKFHRFLIGFSPAPSTDSRRVSGLQSLPVAAKLLPSDAAANFGALGCGSWKKRVFLTSVGSRILGILGIKGLLVVPSDVSPPARKNHDHNSMEVM